MGSGNTVRQVPCHLNEFIKDAVLQNFYALGPGASLSGSHYVGADLSGMYPNCGGVWDIGSDTPGPGFTDANIALNCNGQAGNSVVAPFNFVINNQQLGCVILNFNDGSNLFFNVCGATVAAATACANSVQQASFPQGFLSAPSYTFHPM